MTVTGDLLDFRTHLMRASLFASWKRSNPKEAAAIALYWEGGPRPITIKTEFGQAYLAAADAYAEASYTPPPALDQPMPYPLAPII